MKVWIENPFATLPCEGSRPLRYWLLARAFAAAGCEVVYWTSRFGHATKRFRELPASDGGIAIRAVDAPPYARNVSLARIRNHRAYAREWERLARGEIAASGVPDLLVVSLPPLSTVRPALALAREFGIRLAADAMDDWPGTFLRLLPRFARPLGRLAFAPAVRLARSLYGAADRVTGCCDAYAALTGRADYRRFYHGIELGPAPARRADLTRLVYLGNLGRTYDLATVIAAVRRDLRLTLDVAGAGPCEAGFRRLAADCPRIRFHGLLDAAAMHGLADSAAVGIVPMDAESCVGIPYKLADYAERGLAVVSSLRGESAALIGRYGAGAAYRTGDPDSLLSAIATLTPECGLRAREMAEREFAADAIYPAMVEFLRRVRN